MNNAIADTPKSEVEAVNYTMKTEITPTFLRKPAVRVGRSACQNSKSLKVSVIELSDGYSALSTISSMASIKKSTLK